MKIPSMKQMESLTNRVYLHPEVYESIGMAGIFTGVTIALGSGMFLLWVRFVQTA